MPACQPSCFSLVKRSFLLSSPTTHPGGSRSLQEDEGMMRGAAHAPWRGGGPRSRQGRESTSTWRGSNRRQDYRQRRLPSHLLE